MALPQERKGRMTKDEASDLALEVLKINLTLLEKINPYKGQEDLLSDSLDLTHKAITAIKQARALDKMAENARELGLDYEPAEVLGHNGWGFPIKAAAPVQEPVLKPLSKKWKLVLHESFADVAGFDEEGFPSFYWKESVTKFKSGELSVPCKGKNCGSLNGWLHSAECRAEHEAQYTTPPAAQRQWVGLTKTVVGNHLRRHALGDQSTFRQGFKEGVAFAELKLKEKNNG
jgi:hypothetical protein